MLKDRSRLGFPRDSHAPRAGKNWFVPNATLCEGATLMEISNVLDALKALGGAASVGNLALKIRDWLRDRAMAKQLDPALKAALDKLPNDASGDAIVHVLQTFYAAGGGHVTLKAGADGGGDANLTDTTVEGGSGPGGGGNVTIAAGDGGSHGKGGGFNITGGVIKGGDAS